MIKSIDIDDKISLGKDLNKPVFLDQADRIITVKSGYMDIFAVKCKNKSLESRLHPMGRIDAGKAVFSFKVDFHSLQYTNEDSDSNEKFRIVAYAGEDTLLEADDLPGIEQLPDLLDSIVNWTIVILKGCCSDFRLERSNMRILDRGVSVNLKEGEIVSSDELLWIEQGNNAVFNDDLTPDGGIAENSTMLPVAWNHLLECRTSGTVAPIATDELIKSAGLSPLRRLFVNFHSKLPGIFSGQESEIKEKIDYLEHQKTSALDHVIGHALSVIKLEDYPVRGNMGTPESKDSLFFDAAKIVAHSFGLDIKNLTSSIEQYKTYSDYLADIGSQNGFYVRQISLRNDWPLKDGLSFVGVIEKTGIACAVISKYDHYLIIDPGTGEKTKASRNNSEILSHIAFTFHPVLNHKCSGFEDLWKVFSLNGSRDMSMLVLMSLFVALLALVTPIFTQLLIQEGIVYSDVHFVIYLTAGLITTSIVIVIFDIIRNLAILRIGAKSSAFLQSAVVDRLLKLPVAFFRKYTAGDLAMRTLGVEGIQNVLNRSQITALIGGVFSLVSFVLMFYYSWELALVAVAMVILAGSTTLFFSLCQLKYIRTSLDLSGKASGIAFQMCNGLAKLRIMDKEPQALAKWGEEYSSFAKCSYSSKIIGRTQVISDLSIYSLAQFVIFGSIAWLLKGDISIAFFIAFISAFTQFYMGMKSMTDCVASLLPVNALYRRMKPILDIPTEFDENKTHHGVLKGNIEVNNISFRYDANSQLILNDVSMKINDGEFIAIVGPSGAGKSTLLKLLLGLEKPENGSVFYDDQDISSVRLRQLRKSIGIVTQNAMLIPGTIFENIVGSSPFTIDEAWEAAEMAGLKKDIESFPMGMHTFVAEGFGTFSGGQTQRLIITRAIIKKPAILLLDEATSALDNQTQEIITKSLDRMKITRVVIAHRLSTIRNADHIYVLDKGTIVESGTYDELAKNNQLFTKLIKRQII